MKKPSSKLEAASVSLEKLVAKIQMELAPKSSVKHNVKIIGKSGTIRQVDVLVEDKIGQYDVKIAIECKDYNRPLDIKDVEACQGLFEDISAMRGVIVCPSGFTKGAKARAQGFQIDLYSPLDTDIHKWSVRVKVPAICDFRKAQFRIGLTMSAPLPFMLRHDFTVSQMLTKSEDGKELGYILDIVQKEWDEGRYPVDVGFHERVPILPFDLKMDNGEGLQVPVEPYISVYVDRKLYFGQFELSRLSAFKDEIKETVIFNSFIFGLSSISEITNTWKRIETEEDAPVKPVMILMGLYGEEERQS